MKTTYLFFGLLNERQLPLLQIRGNFIGPPCARLSELESGLLENHDGQRELLERIARRTFDDFADLFEIGGIHRVMSASDEFEFHGELVEARFFHIAATRFIAPRRADVSFDFDPAVRPHDVFVSPFRQLEHLKDAPHQLHEGHCAA